ncbi:hypothetical protein J3D64_005202 [Priestia megaterium]|nr:hypothetical protein [Priestia megaterium]
MTGRDMFGNKISEEQRKASLLQALGIAGAGALSTKVAGKMGQSLATKGTEKLNNMRNTLRTSAVANVTKQAYQSVKNAPASWTQSLHKTYNNILDSSMPRLMPELVPAGPALAQQTVRETLQNVKQQTMQMAQALYNPTVKRYQDPETGRFVANPNVERVEKPVGVEKKAQDVVKDKIKVTTLDGNEHIIKGKNGRKELAPNVQYITEDGYKYQTDELGRIVDVEAGQLILKEADRNAGMQRMAGREDRLPDDDGGHLIGSQFHGSGDIDNLVAQNSQINRAGGEWYKMERQWAKALGETPPKKVSVKIEPVYTGDSLRPSYFEIVYKIEGKRLVKKTIKNQSGG